MNETEIKELKKAVIKRWELTTDNDLIRMIEVVHNQRPKLKIELAEKKYSSFDLSPSIPSINIIKDEAWLAFIDTYSETDMVFWHTAELEEAACNALDKYLEELKNVDFKEDTQDEKTEKIDREAGLAELEKINWRGTETQLVLLVDLLTREALLKSDRKWKMIEEHFLVQGKPTKSKNLSQSLENTLAGKTKDEETLKKIVSEVKKLED
jgi:hypothetical protein